jgi:hypothetical protein
MDPRPDSTNAPGSTTSDETADAPRSGPAVDADPNPRNGDHVCCPPAVADTTNAKAAARATGDE